MAVNIKHDVIILEWEVVSILSSGRTFEVPLHRDFHSHTLSLLHARQVLCHQDTSSSLQHTHTHSCTRIRILQPEDTVWMQSGLKTKGRAVLQRDTRLGGLPWIKTCFAFLSLVALIVKFVSRVVRTDSCPSCGKCRYSHAWRQVRHHDVWPALCLWCSRENWSLAFIQISRGQSDTRVWREVISSHHSTLAVCRLVIPFLVLKLRNSPDTPISILIFAI